MSSYGDINKSHYRRAMTPNTLQDTSTEIHIKVNDGECRYEEIPGFWIETSTDEHVHIFVRICYCKQYVNRSKFLLRNEIYGYEIGNGVDVHNHIKYCDQCRYIRIRLPNELPETISIEKSCNCPKGSYN